MTHYFNASYVNVLTAIPIAIMTEAITLVVINSFFSFLSMNIYLILTTKEFFI